jgi:hypothetical protein
LTRNPNIDNLNLCMKGNVYTTQKCWVCGGKLIHDERFNGCFCPNDPKVRANGNFYVKFGRDIRKRFSTYEDAIRFLTGLRFNSDRGTLDTRDYKASNPMAFDKLAREYLKEKTHLKSYKNCILNYINAAIDYWGDRNVKSIGRKEIKHFLRHLKVSDKTRHNYRSTLHDFFSRFLVEEEVLTREQVPVFPKVEYELGWRTVTDWETQDKILEEIYETEWERNPKCWLAIDMLRTYPVLRPGDIRKITEGGIDLKTGMIIIEKPTKDKKHWRTVRLIDRHINLIREEDQIPCDARGQVF